MISLVKSISLWGIEGFVVDIEVDIETGIPAFTKAGHKITNCECSVINDYNINNK